jgi:hypothetical protein
MEKPDVSLSGLQCYFPSSLRTTDPGVGGVKQQKNAPWGAEIRKLK